MHEKRKVSAFVNTFICFNRFYSIQASLHFVWSNSCFSWCTERVHQIVSRILNLRILKRFGDFICSCYCKCQEKQHLLSRRKKNRYWTWVKQQLLTESDIKAICSDCWPWIHKEDSIFTLSLHVSFFITLATLIGYHFL